MPSYETLSPAVAQRMAQEEFLPGKRYTEGDIIRRIQNPHSSALNLRTPLLRDIDYILHCPYYNRYSDKTQVFSLLKNDDITRRSLHVQLVSRIARTIGTALKLDLDLIEAIALGHDLGHPPFAHIGETFLNEVYHKHTGRYFSHSIQSVRVLDKIFPMNLSLQVLDGIAGHNGELELETYVPGSLSSFEEFDAMMSEVEDEAEDLLKEIAKKEQEYNQKKKEEQAAASKPSGGTSSGGAMPPAHVVDGITWVMPCKYNRFSSPYGWRIHPVYKTWKFHSGVDLGAPSGTPIYASRSGTVTTAKYNSSAGYYVTVNHGDGFSTSYLHMTHYIVGVGDYVKAGQVIGYVGSTGVSTGPHLHFTVYYNGETVNPANFINF